MTKAELRKINLARQKLLSNDERIEKSKQLCKQFFREFNLSKVGFLNLFLAIQKNNEIETRFFYDKIWRDFPQICTSVPRVSGENLELIEFTSETKLVKNSWKIPEPFANNFVDAKLIDVVLVPLLCFDAEGFRVGYGKGFYDKFLSKCRKDCLKIGLSYFAPIEKIDDVNEFDVRLNYCLTPENIVNCK